MRAAAGLLIVLLCAAPAASLPLIELPDPRAPQPVAGTLACPATSDTSGAGDGAFPTLAWAALKTGFRFGAAFESADEATATLDFTVDGGPLRRVVDPIERRQHAFVLDALPHGALLCFRVASGGATGDAHAVRLANAMNARRPDGVYTINLLVDGTHAANELAHLDASHAETARRLLDATDGHVALGRVITLVGDPLAHDSGLATCAYPFLAVQTRAPACDRVFDVVWTYDTFPQQAAGTNRDAIQTRHLGIFMNNLWETLLASGTAEEAGGTLAHELGHYAFGMNDLYSTAGGGCVDPRWSISVMADSRTAREFDDVSAPCPGPLEPSYVPSWNLLRARFPGVPARPSGPAVGPFGVGPAFAQTTHVFIESPQVDQPWKLLP